MSKLIVLSNRVTLPEPDTTQAGGLAVALEDALHGIGGVWMGWNGKKTTHSTRKFDHLEHQGIAYHTCALSEQEYIGFYCNFANSALWPLMHDQPQRMDYTEQDYKIYQNVNLKFAKQLHQIAQPEDIIWIHDYHFLSVAYHCRQLGMKNRIGFFLHIPFPDAKKWSILAQSAQLAEHMASYDIFGLQTQQDQRNCYEVLNRLSSLSAYTAEIIKDLKHQRSVRVKAYPISVHPSALQRRAKQATQHNSILPFEFEPHIKHIISVDRIDYSKGILEKIHSFTQLLESHPQLLEQFRQLQVACPCRLEVPAYRQLYADVSQSVAQLNEHYSTLKHPLFDCRFETYDHTTLMQLYRRSEICWINSVKDGMNLVAKEYIAAQDPDDPGVLVLSKYAGAAEQMKQALIIDPYDQNSINKALLYALKMSKSERHARYQALYQGLVQDNILKWRNNYLYDLNHVNTYRTYRPLSATQQTGLFLH